MMPIGVQHCCIISHDAICSQQPLDEHAMNGVAELGS